MKNRLLSAILGLAASLFAYGAQAQTELVVSHSFGFLVKTHQAISDTFAKEHPGVKITHRAPSKDFEEGHETIVRQSITGQLPDVHFPGLARYREIVSRGLAIPLDPLLVGQMSLEQEGYVPALLNLTKVDGKLYGLPFLTGTPITLVNATLVRRAGGDPDNLPRTWDGMTDLAARIKALDPAIAGGLFPMTDDWLFQALVYSAGGRILSPDGGDVVFDGPEGIRALTTLARFVKESGSILLPVTSAYQQFAAGTVGIMPVATGRLGSISQQVGDKFEMRTTVFPSVDPERNLGMPVGGAAAVVLTKDPRRQKLALDYIRFATGPVGQSFVVGGAGYTPVHTRAFEIESVREFFEQNPLRKPDIEQMKTAKPWVAFPGENSVKIVRSMKDNTERVVQKSATPDQALADMAREVRALLPR